MNNTPLGLNPFAIVAIALIVVAIVLIWANVRNQQMKHELKLKVLEQGRDVDPHLLASLLAVDSGRAPLPQKSIAEQHRDAGGFIGFLFLIAGLIFAFVGMVRGPDLSWPLLGLGAFSFAFGYRCWIGAMKEYQREKAEESRT